MIRRKVIKTNKTTEKNSTTNKKDKNSKKKDNSPSQFFFIKNCLHNLNSKHCPMCKLIEKETSLYLQNEKLLKNKLQQENFYLRSQMRYYLLHEWSSNQLINYSDVLLLPTAEITLCSSIVDALSTCSSLQVDLQHVEKNLLKRNKILEVGNYAAIYLQCRIRGLCCRKRITQFLLRRFEYHEESLRKSAYFLDKNNGNRFYTTPYLISHERPGSPRTIQRRIKFQNEIKDKRMEKYLRICKNGMKREGSEGGGSGGGGGHWSETEKGIVSARQMVLLRDVLFCLFKELSNKRRENGEKPTSILIINNNDNNNTGNNNTGNNQMDGGNQRTETVFSYWFTMSNPAPPARQLYLSLALETEPLTEEEIIVNPITAEDESNGLQETKQSGKSSQGKRVSINNVALVSTVDSDSPQQLQEQQVPLEPVFDLNDRLQQLENRIWQLMQSNSADEMILKLIQCEEINPAMSSCQQIAEDGHKIWRNDIPTDNNESEKSVTAIVKKEVEEKNEKSEEDIRDLAVMGQYKRALSTKSFSKEFSRQNSYLDEFEQSTPPPPSEKVPPPAPNLQHGVYLPCQLQIHPFYPNRQPSGIFRLFFVDGVLAAMTPNSQWVFYPDVWKHRVHIIKSVCEFVESKPIKTLIRTYMSRANESILSEQNKITTTTTSNNNNNNTSTTNQSMKLKDSAPMPPRQYDPSYRGNMMFASTTTTTSQPTPQPITQPESQPAISNVISVVLPDEKTIFGNYPSFEAAQLTGSEYRTIDQKYRFLRKMKAWKDARRQTLSEPKIDTGSQLERQMTISNTNIPPPGKLTQIPPTELLLGSTIFRLSCVDTPKSSLSYQTKYHLASLGGGVAYRSLLKRSVNEIDTTMSTKIFPPTGNENTKAVETPITPPPIRNVIVIDVHVTIPIEELQVAPQVETKKQGERRMSRRQSNLPPNLNANPNATKTQSKPKFLVETHQVVGIFSSSVDKAPASLDTGLFTWQQLIKIAAKAANLREIMKSPMTQLTGGMGELDTERRGSADYSSTATATASSSTTTSLSSLNRPVLPSIQSIPSPSSSIPLTSRPNGVVDMSLTHTIKLPTPMNDDTVNWTLVTPQSGIYGTKVSLGAGMNLEVRFIGRVPDREYLEKTIPKKIRKWVGLRC